jgi:hypothetical protein
MKKTRKRATFSRLRDLTRRSSKLTIRSSLLIHIILGKLRVSTQNF